MVRFSSFILENMQIPPAYMPARKVFLNRNRHTSYQKGVLLRVFAGEILGAYCRECRQPESDFDETRTRGASGPKTKFGDPFSAQTARSAGPGASKVVIFEFF